MRLFVFDALPQVFGIVAGLFVLAITSNLTLFVLTQLVFNVVAVAASARVILRGSKDNLRCSWSAREAVRRLSHQRDGVITAGTGALYVNLPLVAVSLFIPASLDIYTLADRLLRYAVTAFAPVLQFVQGWIPESGTKHVRHRIKRAVQFTPLIGACGAAAIIFGAPVASMLLLDGQAELPFSLSIPFGVTFFSVALSQVIGLAGLVTVGESSKLARSTVLGAVVGTPFIIVGSVFAGVEGVAWAVAVSEAAVVTYQAFVLRRHFVSTRANVGLLSP